MKRKISIYILDRFKDEVCEEIHEVGSLATLCALMFSCKGEYIFSTRYCVKILFG